tara:strand:- start:726 stop:1592 length:867 start_codon:yes stop_codon:yes gene_type:complete
MKKEFFIAQISDMHIVGNESLNILNNIQLEKTIKKINKFKPKIDLIVATGDLTDNGYTNEYKVLQKIFSKSVPDVLMIPGNHDKRKNLIKIFSNQEYLLNNKFFCYTVSNLPVFLIFLDTLVEGKPGGEICKERFLWLKERLFQNKDKPTIIFLHHPPFNCGIWWMDAIGLKGRKELKKLIESYTNIEAILAGHIHRSIQKKWAGTFAHIAPSTAHQIELDISGNKFLHINDEPPAFSLHHWSADNGLTSHICYTEKSKSYVNSKIKDINKYREFFIKAKLELDKFEK